MIRKELIPANWFADNTEDDEDKDPKKKLKHARRTITKIGRQHSKIQENERRLRRLKPGGKARSNYRNTKADRLKGF